MAYQAVFKRKEMKYLLTEKQYQGLMWELRDRIVPDDFPVSTISNLYYDTPDARLVRASLEKPLFKEKIRLRSYGPADESSPVFLELKRKAFGIVYKRRIQSTIPEVNRFFDGRSGSFPESQITREIQTFRDYYGTLVPACMIIYDRTAYFETDGDLRLTIDENPRYRMTDLRLDKSMEGISLLPEGWSVL